jgi:2'-hydroxyisoflavone reductase
MTSTTRRTFVTALAGAGALAGAPQMKKKILILGGTGFLGPATVAAARARGHELTLFNRGKTRPALFKDLEILHGDRDPLKDEGLKALEGRKWDTVIDNSGYYPRMVAASAKLLAPNAKQYIFISSISAYADNTTEGQDESGKLSATTEPDVEKITDASYGPLKVLCEKAAQDAFQGRAAIVRPGYIVGPDDPSGRFTYWPVRMDRGGEVLAPGAPPDPVQIIDVRDLGAWLITLAEQQTAGVFNACGPKERLKWGDLLQACQKATKATSKLTWVPDAWVARQGNEVFPIWAPYAGDSKGFHTWKNARAIQAGLKFRPVQQTVSDTLAWYKSQSERTKLAGPGPEQEAELLAKWKSAAK